MTKGLRIVTFLLLASSLLFIFWYFTGSPIPTDPLGLYVFTALLGLAFASQIIEHYFTKPADVLSASVAVLLLTFPVREHLTKLDNWFYGLVIYSLCSGVLAALALALFNPKQLDNNRRNVISKFLRDIAIKVGNSRVQFFCAFVLVLIFYFDSKTNYFAFLFVFSAIVLIEPWKFLLKLKEFLSKDHPKGIGSIVGVQSKNSFLVKLHDGESAVKVFDFVEFKYLGDGNTNVRRGLIFEDCLLNHERWIKVMVNAEFDVLLGTDQYNQFDEPNTIFRIEKPIPNNYLERFVGTIHENTNIQTIRFVFNSQKEICEGQLVEVTVQNKKVLYQVIDGTTKVEQLEQKNESGFIVAEAFQLGIWQPENERFEKFGWVPTIDSPVYLASDIEEPVIAAGDYQIGKIPNSNYPVIINKEYAITHHTAILGVTGTGKSFFARNLVRQIASETTKVIIIDLSGEYREKIADIASIISDADATGPFEAVDFIIKEMGEFPNNRKYNKIEEAEAVIVAAFEVAINAFLDGQQTKCIFELPDITNNADILDYTKWFFSVLFRIAKERKADGNRICVVIEEAHTIVPEYNSMGVSSKAATATVNSIAQIALQGRKYGIGFFIIAQRTANVSKTVLTQCNSIIAFQEFDKTSNEFLANYMGPEFVKVMPNLKTRHAIAVGKAFKSTVPMIFEVPDIVEPDVPIAEPQNQDVIPLAANPIEVQPPPDDDIPF